MSPDSLCALLHQPGATIHFIGVGGIGMAGLAALLAGEGRKRSGSDQADSALTERLAAGGLTVHRGHATEHVPVQADLVIRSSAIPPANPEWKAAIDQGIPVVRRGEALAAFLQRRELIAVCGTHGKTTTTAMIAHLFRSAGEPMGWYVGGESALLGDVAEDAPRLVAECDESDGTLVHYRPAVSVITNIEFDHMETFDREEDFLASFTTLVERSGSVISSCDPVARELAGTQPIAPTQVRLEAERSWFDAGDWTQLELGVGGQHNVENAMLAVDVARRYGLAESAVRLGLASFRHVGRRFETVYKENGIHVVSDYAHHPTEVRVVIQTARQYGAKRLLAVFQPHRYSRTAALKTDFPPAFADLDRLWLVPVYAASEAAIPGGSAEDLQTEFHRQNVTCEYVSSLDSAWAQIRTELRAGDMLLILGAGDVNKIEIRTKELRAL